MAKKKSRAQLEAENKYLRRGRVAEISGPLINSLIKWVGLVIIVYYCFRSIEVLAGKNTDADININVLSSFLSFDFGDKVAVVIGIIGFFLCICGIIYGKCQRRLRLKTVERLQGRIEELERSTDPGRSSSKLTPKGETRPEDR